MSKQLYDISSQVCSKVITNNYSTSFSMGIRTLHKKYRMPVYSIYGFVRLADEIVDTFHDFDKKTLLESFKEDTYQAINKKISLNPILNAFQLVVNQYGIERELIDAFLLSMEMDLSENEHNHETYTKYIYGSAEVVGLMCLRVFVNGDGQLYEELKEPARRLGAAFQKVNFLRDIQSDYQDRGRVYFPGIDFEHFKNKEKDLIEKDIQEDFIAAYDGIVKLPKGSRKGVYLAYIYYLKLFHKIKKLPASKILSERVRIPDITKIALLLPVLVSNNLSSPEFSR
ncbi:MAG: phytoene/squalene synthase family protein [Cyclobacteriaceae bacterium]